MADDDIDFDPYDIDDADEDEIPSEAEVEARRREEAAFDDWRALKLAIRRANLVRMAEPTNPPFMLGRYQALETVEGGMGIVVIGRDPDLDRKVAIKLWKDEGLVAETALRAEAQTLAKLNHPNVVSVYDVGKYKSSVYFVMESVEGTNGHDWIGECSPTWQEVRAVFVAAGSGLAAAHVAGIHHRDFKPENVLVGHDGRVLVLDFGIAGTLHATDESSERDAAPDLPADPERGRTGAGTVAYMAPERLRGRRGDARSDQFSFCVSMWKALHRVRPFGGYTSDGLLAAISRGVLRTGSYTAEVPHWLSRIVRKGLAEDPDLRYRDMHELLAALRDGPVGGDAVEGELVDGALGGAAGRLLNAPETSGASGRVELSLDPDTSALLREFVKVLSPGSRPNGETLSDQPSASAGIFAPPPNELAAGRKRQRRALMLASVVSGIVSGMLVLVTLRPPAPTAIAVEPPQDVTADTDALDVILAHIAEGEFGKAEELWTKHRREKALDEDEHRLSDDDSLAVGRACLARAKQLQTTNPTQAAVASHLAHQIATFVEDSGRDSRAKEAGSQLIKDVNEFARSRLPARGDATGG